MGALESKIIFDLFFRCDQSIIVFQLQPFYSNLLQQSDTSLRTDVSQSKRNRRRLHTKYQILVFLKLFGHGKTRPRSLIVAYFSTARLESSHVNSGNDNPSKTFCTGRKLTRLPKKMMNRTRTLFISRPLSCALILTVDYLFLRI